MRVVDMFRFQAREYPDREFGVHNGRRLTYGEADEAVLRTVAALRASGLGQNDRVGVLSVNCPEFMTIYLACALVGCVPVPLNYRLTERELAYILQDSGAVMLIVSPEFKCSNEILTIVAMLSGEYTTCLLRFLIEPNGFCSP